MIWLPVVLAFIGIVMIFLRPRMPTVHCMGCRKRLEPFDTPWIMDGFIGHCHCWFRLKYPEESKDMFV